MTTVATRQAYTAPTLTPCPLVNSVLHGDALEALRTLPDNSVDAVVSDPPAGIHFMNMPFDSDKGGRDAWIAWLSEIMREALRVLKPGGHALIWALPRTSHWTATALEDAGWEIRDEISHHYATDTRLAAFVASLNAEQRSAWEMLVESQERPSVVQQLFGSGFPKSHNASKAIEAEIINQLQLQGIEFTGWEDE